MMVIDRLLREADPVADWHVDPESTRARAMLADTLATPRPSDAERFGPAAQGRRGSARLGWRRRIVFGGAVAAAVTLAISVPWTDGPNGSAAAYAVTAMPDGSVELTVRWERMEDVGRLAGELRAAGVPTEVTTTKPARYCGVASDQDRTTDALNKRALDGDPASTSADGYVMRPTLFPAGSVLVIATFSEPATEITYTTFYLAPAGSTSCALTYLLGSARYTGAGPHPTYLRFPAPEPG